MNALRSSSAFARRSLATPPHPAAPLSYSSSRLFSSSSSSSSSFSQRSISASLLLRPQKLAAASRWSGSIPSPYLTQSRTMASESKIKVKNPVVELDGDEVWRPPTLYSLNSGRSGPRITSNAAPRDSGGAFSSCPSLSTRGNTGNRIHHSDAHPHPNMTLNSDATAILGTCADRWIFVRLVDDPYHLAGDQRKGEPRNLFLLFVVLARPA